MRSLRTSVDFVLIGGMAGILRGLRRISSYDVDIAYGLRARENLEKLAAALNEPWAPNLRGAPADVPFILDAETLRERGALHVHDALWIARHPQ